MNEQHSFEVLKRSATNLSEVDMPITVIGTPGDDVITGSTGDEIYYPGASQYSQIIYDWGGDDTYVLEATSYTEIFDYAGFDVVTMAGYDLADLNFAFFDQYTLAIWSDDNLIGAWFTDMWNNPGIGVDSLVLDDVTLSREQIVAYADANFGL